MEFYLRSCLKTSADPKDAKQEIEQLLTDAEKTILTKGAPEGEGAKITEWNLSDSGIFITIVSGRYVRSHDAIARLKKPLADLLGKKYRIGIRGIEAEEFKIRLPADKGLKNKNIPYVKSVTFENNMLELELEMGESEMRNRVPDRILSLIEDKLKQDDYGAKAEHWNLLWESEDKEFEYFKDPTEDMLENGWLKRGVGRGQWVHGPKITKLFRTFEQIVIDELVKPLGFEEMIFPKLVMWDIWKQSGHAKGIYPEIYYVCAPKTRDPEYWEDVMDYYKVTHEVPTHLLKDKITEPIGGMCYAQCPPAWTYFQGTTIANESVPIKIFDRSGTSHRYESGGIHGIERVDEFHRIELVWIGKPEQTVDVADKLHEQYMKIFNDILQLKWRKAWVTPWFMAQEGLVGLSNEKRVGTTDYEAPLPYKGENGEWLEFQNLSINGDKYPSGFNVKLQSGDELWSGCSGVGLERWAAVFLAQHGLDETKWPETFRNRFGDMPKDIIFY
ncbi:MAG: serine--tRNA ligase [Methanosarcinaceae archaeon]|nr:serine--tRNA ligase [Methanosarcinaceae archaeon]